jgi:glycosyltransferase involved in cell wall biosynthesis
MDGLGDGIRRQLRKVLKSAIMNIAFISRATLFSSPGGDTIQMEMMARSLRDLGHRVDVLTTGEKVADKQYDLLHFFNLTRPADMLSHIKRASCPIFITPIFLDLGEYEIKNPSKGPLQWIARLLPSGSVEYLKCLARFIKNGERINSTYYLLHGHNRSIKKVLSCCDGLMPNSESELSRIQRNFSFTCNQRVIPCGIDKDTLSNSKGIAKEENLVLSVGRIERRKNQLSLIKALNNSDYKLIIIGNPSPNHRKYYESCRDAAGTNVSFIHNIPQKELAEYYHRARVHVLPSWFETAGLSSLEAAACGCNIVVADKGDVSDYFKGDAWYCDPGDEQSIFAAVDAAMKAPVNDTLQHYILQHLNWQDIAAQTMAFYQQQMSLQL